MKKTLAALAALSVAAVTYGTVASAGDGGPFKAELEPGQEVAPFTGKAGASGFAKVVAKPGKGELCVDITTSGLDLAVAHVHEAAAGANGPVVIDLTSLVDPASGTVDGCVAASGSLLREIVAEPGDYYVNVHEASITVAIRGQLG